jgi:hypothetical protein
MDRKSWNCTPGPVKLFCVNWHELCVTCDKREITIYADTKIGIVSTPHSMTGEEKHTMKTTHEILKYIDMRYNEFLDIPKSYFLSPQAMEITLVELELLYEFIVDDSWSPPRCLDFGYFQFLEDEGYGVAQFTTRKPQDSQTFEKMANFWRKYLNSNRRKRIRNEG